MHEVHFDYNIRQFDPKRMKDDRACVFVGGSGSGKSFAIRDILSYHRDIPAGIVFSGTEAADPFYSEFVPSLFIYDDFIPRKIDE